MRRFELIRDEDQTGISGTGLVAEGMEWPDGHVALRWGQEIHSTVLYANVDDVVSIHGHGGKTRLVWLDPEPGYPDGDELIPMCCMCFGGDHLDRMPTNHCLDCGAGGALVYIPKWAVKGIRDHDKDRLDSLRFRTRELQFLRALLPVPPNFSVKAAENDEPEDPPRWNVTVTRGNRTITTGVRAATAEEALREGANRLPWIPKETEPRIVQTVTADQ